MYRDVYFCWTQQFYQGFLLQLQTSCFFVVLRVEILDFIADFEVDLIALSSALHACGIASRWEEASPGNGAMGSRYFQSGSKRLILEHDEMDIYEKIICEETMAKNLRRALTCDIVLLYDSCPRRMEMYEISNLS